MAGGVNFWIFFCWTSVLPLLSTAHVQTGSGLKSATQTSQLDTPSEQLQFIENLRRVLKEEHALQDSSELCVPTNNAHFSNILVFFKF